jgi:hydroxymethylbilane synthase
MTPPHAPRRLVIATRQSALAMWQARHVQGWLQSLYPRAAIELLGLTTEGDRIIDRPLAAIGGKGLFIKELEVAMAEARADVAVHSLKDVPMEIPEGFALAAVCAREDARDAFVSNRYATLRELPPGAIVGTSSLRREAQLRERFAALDVRSLRGNVNTRLRKLDEKHYDAIILAAAGLKRLGLADRIRDLIDPADSLPAPGQGALAIECRADRGDVVNALAPLNDTATLLATTAERAFSRALSGSCRTPIAAYGTWQEGTLWLRGLIASQDGREVMRGEREGEIIDVEAADALGTTLAGELLAHGASRLIVSD